MLDATSGGSGPVTPATPPVPTSETVVDIGLHFKEPSGSVYPYRATTTLGALGVEVSADNSPKKPTREEIDAALDEDGKNPQSNVANTQWSKLIAKFAVLNQRQQNPIATRLREALVEFLSKGGVPGHEIDAGKYTWEGGVNSMTVSGQYDDALGTLTGKPNSFFFQVAGAAVWGD